MIASNTGYAFSYTVKTIPPLNCGSGWSTAVNVVVVPGRGKEYKVGVGER